MDVNVLRSVTTLFMFLVFIGIVFWAMSGRRRADFDAAAQLPFLEARSAETAATDLPAAGQPGGRSGEKP
jgi:cytochrome c oxidase cbb3-type subunit 4